MFRRAHVRRDFSLMSRALSPALAMRDAVGRVCRFEATMKRHTLMLHHATARAAQPRFLKSNISLRGERDDTGRAPCWAFRRHAGGRADDTPAQRKIRAPIFRCQPPASAPRYSTRPAPHADSLNVAF